jgi:hypothetical protein
VVVVKRSGCFARTSASVAERSLAMGTAPEVPPRAVVSDFLCAQAKGVGDDADGGQRHRGGGDDGGE